MHSKNPESESWESNSGTPKFVRDFCKNHLPSQMGVVYSVNWKTPSQQLISSGDKRRKRGCSSRQENPPILYCGMKGVGADTSHHRSDLVLNTRLGARIFIYIIFSKTQRHASKQLSPRRLTNYFSGDSKQTPILLFQCVLF